MATTKRQYNRSKTFLDKKYAEYKSRYLAEGGSTLYMLRRDQFGAI